jgi:hypothetical protein
MYQVVVVVIVVVVVVVTDLKLLLLLLLLMLYGDGSMKATLMVMTVKWMGVALILRHQKQKW